MRVMIGNSTWCGLCIVAYSIISEDMRVDVQLALVSFERKSVLHNLMELCQHDYSEFSGEEVKEHGHYAGLLAVLPLG